MAAVRHKVRDCISQIGDTGTHSLIVESLNWLVSHRSKCERLTEVSEEQVTIKNYEHSDWAFGLSDAVASAAYATGAAVFAATPLGIYCVTKWRQSLDNVRKPAPTGQPDRVEPSYNKLTADADIRRFTQMYSNQTPLPTSAIAQRRVTVVKEGPNGHVLSDNYVNPENRVIYVK